MSDKSRISLDPILSATPLGSNGEEKIVRQPSPQGAEAKQQQRKPRDGRSRQSGGGQSSLGFPPDAY